jgi:hypothetical protein
MSGTDPCLEVRGEPGPYPGLAQEWANSRGTIAQDAVVFVQMLDDGRIISSDGRRRLGKLAGSPTLEPPPLD